MAYPRKTIAMKPMPPKKQPIIPAHPPNYALDHKVVPTGAGTMRGGGAATKGKKFEGTY